MEIADILFSIGTMSFSLASIRQVRKIHKDKSTDGVSLTHYHVKMIAVSLMLSGYTISFLPLSICVSLMDMSINLIAIRLITKYRGISFFHL